MDKLRAWRYAKIGKFSTVCFLQAGYTKQHTGCDP